MSLFKGGGDEPFNISSNSERVELHTPTLMPKASGFLWNSKMMLQMNCRGYVVSQFMQPEPAKYSHAPNLEAKTFMMPEHAYFTHHPGRFFYIKDEDSGELFSAPYEPVRGKLDKFNFSIGANDIRWYIEKQGVRVEIKLTLAKDDVLEIWQLKVTNLTEQSKKLSIYPYFTIGYMSWMNQSARFDQELNAVVASSVTPYQKVEDYFKHQEFKDQTFLLAEKKPNSFCMNQALFEGEGGLHNPDGIKQILLPTETENYAAPVAVLQYRVNLLSQKHFEINFLFGPAKDKQEIQKIRQQYFSDELSVIGILKKSNNEYSDYIAQGKGCLKIETPDKSFDHFVNHWLPRQIFYHGDVNRLSSDPQTRNYLQDNMGMCYIKPKIARQAFLTALAQQLRNGAMPDGILLHPDAELKYINQIPHADHSVWIPICLSAYLNEHNDYELLDEKLPFADSKDIMTVKQHIDLAMDWLLQARDHRGLSFIEQGDWCDPMNMVGYKGKGVSGWLSLATAYALNLWSDICEQATHNNQSEKSIYENDNFEKYRHAAKEINDAVNKYLWDGQWFARGITDDDVVFGVAEDKEGRIFLNPQSWAMLSGAADEVQIKAILLQIEKQLDTPYGVMMLAPSYTKMRDDVGRVTQKSPGVAENGSVYNHAAIFYAFSLYQKGKKELAFDVLRKMIPGNQDAKRRGQLPVYIPNYYRGAYYQFPDSAGRSSQLFNTGTVSWFYRCLIEGLCGLTGDKGDLVIDPQLPDHWPEIKVERHFSGAIFKIVIAQTLDTHSLQIEVNGELLATNRISHIQSGKLYRVMVKIPSIKTSLSK